MVLYGFCINLGGLYGGHKNLGSKPNNPSFFEIALKYIFVLSFSFVVVVGGVVVDRSISPSKGDQSEIVFPSLKSTTVSSLFCLFLFVFVCFCLLFSFFLFFSLFFSFFLFFSLFFFFFFLFPRAFRFPYAVLHERESQYSLVRILIENDKKYSNLRKKRTFLDFAEKEKK